MSRIDGICTNYMRMKPEHFDHLLLVKEGLTKKDYRSIKFSVYCILPMASFHHGKVFKILNTVVFTSKSKLLGEDSLFASSFCSLIDQFSCDNRVNKQLNT